MHAVDNYLAHQLHSPSVALHDCKSTIIKCFMLTCVVSEQTLVWGDDGYDECELIRGEIIKAEQRDNIIVRVKAQLRDDVLFVSSGTPIPIYYFRN